MEMAPGALLRPSRVPEQRLLFPEIRRRRWRSCGTLSRNLPIPLGFSIGRLFKCGGAASEGHQNGLTIGGCGQGLGRAPWWWPCPLAPLRLSFGPRPSSGKIGVSVFGLSNSENISCAAFLKHKTAENRELALWHLVSRLVPEIA
jgi:hypothetical protein